jgi:CheY-like chemotaxis protein
MAAYLTKPVTAATLQHELGCLGDVQDVLVIDDDRGFCQLIERTLHASSSRYRVRQAYDGWDGLANMRRHRPDVVLLDLFMPDLDGFQVLEEMRRDPALDGVEVILVTAADLAEDALLRQSKQMTIHRPDGLRLGEILRCLAAVMDVLKPRYDERSLSAAPVGRT